MVAIWLNTRIFQLFRLIFFIFWLSLLNIEEHLGNERDHVQWRSDGGGGGGGNDYGGGSDGGVGSSSGSIGIDMTMQQ